MADGQEYRFHIGAYSPKTMPLGRLTEYLQELLTLLGNSDRLHLTGVHEGSTQPVIYVEQPYVKEVNKIAENIKSGAASARKMNAYRNINKMLAEDEGKADLSESENGAVIIPFPGTQPDTLILSGMKESGVVEGKLMRVGGIQDKIPLILTGTDDKQIAGCYTDRARAKQLAHHLFDTVRLVGEGTWQREETGIWQMSEFKVDNFEVIEPSSFTEDFIKLRAIDVEWPEDFDEKVMDSRRDEKAKS